MPPSASRVEKAADLAFARHIERIPVERIFDQWHAQRCPAELLGWLAWAVSVDDWNPDWPEAVKRDVIRASIDVHRHKGTLYGVERALSALAIATRITEWTEDTQSGTPHSFTVSAFANQNFASGNDSVLDENFYRLVRQQVTNNKPVRSQFDIHVGAAFSSALGVHTAMGAVQSQRHESTLKQDAIRTNDQLQMATCARFSAITRDNIHPLPDTSLAQTRIRIAVAGGTVTLTQATMEAA